MKISLKNWIAIPTKPKKEKKKEEPASYHTLCLSYNGQVSNLCNFKEV